MKRAVLVHAAELLELDAKCLRDSETVGGKWELLTEFDRSAKAAHDDMIDTATKLRELAALEAL